MCIPVVSSDAAVMAAVLLDTAALIEESGAAGLSVTCSCDRARILVTTSAGGAARRAALVAALGELAGAGRYRQYDITGENPAAWLETAGKAGGTVIEVITALAVRAVPGGTLAAGPAGERASGRTARHAASGIKVTLKCADHALRRPGSDRDSAAALQAI